MAIPREAATLANCYSPATDLRRTYKCSDRRRLQTETLHRYPVVPEARRGSVFYGY